MYLFYEFNLRYVFAEYTILIFECVNVWRELPNFHIWCERYQIVLKGSHDQKSKLKMVGKAASGPMKPYFSSC